MAEFLMVTGTGKASLPADLAEIGLTLGGLDLDYTKAMDASDRLTEKLKTELGQTGFRSDDIKTQRFDIQPEYEGRDVVERQNGQESHRYRQEFVGYRWTHQMVLEFPRDQERLGRVLWLLAHSETGCEFHLRFKVADIREVRRLAAADAVRNAQDVAKTLAETAGLKLGNVRNITYAFQPVNIYSRTETALSAKMMAPAESYQMDLVPEDVRQEEQVTMEFAVVPL